MKKEPRCIKHKVRMLNDLFILANNSDKERTVKKDFSKSKRK